METGVAHDYSNFLTAILGNISIILNGLPEDAPLRRNAEQVESAALKALELTNLLCECSGHVNADMLPVNITDTINNMKPELRAMVPEEINLDFKLGANLPEVSGNVNFLKQLVTNLVSNAAESLQDENGQITISTGTLECNPSYCMNLYFAEKLPNGQYVYVDVSDNGQGISDAIEDRIFDPFFSTKIRGKGLGLPTVMGILRAHHGGIKVDSTPGKGSSFRVLLPATTRA